MKGLGVNVYRSPHEATNGGLSSKSDRFVLTGEGMPEIFEPKASQPELHLRRFHGDWVAFPPFDPAPNCVGWMFGGNFVYTSDSRFHPGHPIRVHDRQETQQRYKDLGA